MKIGAFIPQGWRMDLNGISVEDQWKTIINSAENIENLRVFSTAHQPAGVGDLFWLV